MGWNKILRLTPMQDAVMRDIAVITDNPPQNKEDFYEYIAEVNQCLIILLELHKESHKKKYENKQRQV